MEISEEVFLHLKKLKKEWNSLVLTWAISCLDMMSSTVTISCNNDDKKSTLEQNDGKMFVLDAAVEPGR